MSKSEIIILIEKWLEIANDNKNLIALSETAKLEARKLSRIWVTL